MGEWGSRQNIKELETLFKVEVCDRAKEIDPNESQDWFSLSLGWAIAKGVSPENAWEFATHVRYELHYFQEA